MTVGRFRSGYRTGYRADSGLWVPGGVPLTYSEKVLGVQPANLIAYWPLSETSGTNADNVEGTAARDGTFGRNVTTMGTSTGIGDGGTAPDFDGTNDYCDIYSTSLNTAFNDAEGTVAIWARVSGAGIWTDSTARTTIKLRADFNNEMALNRHATNGQLQLFYKAAGTLEFINITGLSTTDWFHLALTWSKSGDKVIVYYNGSQSGVTQTGLGIWAGALASDRTIIGSNVTTPANQWDGYLAHAAIWDTPLSAGDVLSLATA